MRQRPEGFTGATYSALDPHISPAERLRTRQKTAAAIRSGKLIRQPCEGCGRTESIQAHHTDYSDHLAIKWLCLWCHCAEHQRISNAAVFGVWRQQRARHTSATG